MLEGDSNNGGDNTFCSNGTGVSLSTGASNSFFGHFAGRNNTTGIGNVAIGHSAQNHGNLPPAISKISTCIGINSKTSGLFNSTSIGANSQAVTDHTMILGDNNVNVGIGMSGLTPGNKLEINTANAYASGATGYSGLRFTDMRSGSLGATGNGIVLSVDGNGDVVLVNDQGAGTLSICTSPGLAINYLTKNSTTNEICRSYVYEESTAPYRVGIGQAVCRGRWHNWP